MACALKPFSCLFLLVIVVCGVSFQVSNVNGELTASVPEFSVKLVANPYDVPSTSTSKIDPYTGKETVITTPGYHVENKSIEVIIENQYDASGSVKGITYRVRIKGHFEDRWDEPDEYYPANKNSKQTIISFPANYPQGGLVDFQVVAVWGMYSINLMEGRPTLPMYQTGYSESTGWSNTQTLTIDFESIPEFPSWTLLPLFAIAVLAVVIINKKL